MNDNLINQLKTIIKGDVLTDEQALQKYSRDASIFEIKPQLVIIPKDTEDLKNAVTFTLVGMIVFGIHFPLARRQSKS